MKISDTIVLTGSGALSNAVFTAFREKFHSINIVRLSRSKRFNCEQIDFSNPEELEYHLEKSKPKYFFHFAGRTVGDNFEDFLDSNVKLTHHIFEALYKLKSNCKVIIPGSAAEYGHNKESIAINEEYPRNPVTFYGLSKKYQTDLALYYSKKGINVCVARIFNLIGGAASSKVLLEFAEQIVAIKHRIKEPVVEAGNIDVIRDFIDLKDVSSALIQLALNGRNGQVYNVCSGKPVTLKQAIEMMSEKCQIRHEISRKHSLVRENDVWYSVGSNGKLSQETGWSPNVAISDSIADLLAHEESKYQNAKK